MQRQTNAEQVSMTSRLTLAHESDGIKYDPDGVTKPRDHVVGTLDLIQEVIEEPETKTKHSPEAKQNSKNRAAYKWVRRTTATSNRFKYVHIQSWSHALVKSQIQITFTVDATNCCSPPSLPDDLCGAPGDEEPPDDLSLLDARLLSDDAEQRHVATEHLKQRVCLVKKAERRS